MKLKGSTIAIGVVAVALGAVAILYVSEAKAAKPPAVPPAGGARPLPSKSGGGGGGSDYVLTTSQGQLTTRNAQSMLQAIGAAAGGSQNMINLVVDGAWGPKTQAAVKDFQTVANQSTVSGPPIATDGIVGPQTASLLKLAYQGLAGAPSLPGLS